jgi:ribonucleotide reductase beta subunit family protein with ferritin-like domain
MNEEKMVKEAIRKYAKHYASQETDKMKYGQGENLGLNVQIYSAYASLLASERIEKLTYVLAFSTLALAVLNFIFLFLR